jgi:lysyl-tRNA synthetase class I
MPIRHIRCPGCSRVHATPASTLANGRQVACKCSCGARYAVRRDGNGQIVVDQFTAAAAPGPAEGEGDV